jgi:uncharacterized membrane protein
MDPMMQQGAGGPGGKTKTLGLAYNIAGLLCYLPVCGIGPLLSLVFIFTEPKESKFVRFHAFQALLTFVASFALFFLLGCAGGIIVPMMPDSLVGIIGLVLSLVQLVLGLGILAILVMGMIKAYGNQIWKAPVLGGIAEGRA